MMSVGAPTVGASSNLPIWTRRSPFSRRRAAKAALRAGDLPWDWLAEALTSSQGAPRLSIAARAAAPRDRWPALKRAAAVAVLKAGQGVNLDYLGFSFEGTAFACSSRWRSQGLIVDVDVAPPVPPRRIVRSRPKRFDG